MVMPYAQSFQISEFPIMKIRVGVCVRLRYIYTHIYIHSTLQHTATHCNTLQHTATHCNTLQHTTTFCNTLRYIYTHIFAVAHTYK